MLKVVQTYLSNGQLHEAISKVMFVAEHNGFSYFLKSSILLRSQICRVNSDFLFGLISNETKEMTLNRCTLATLSLAEEVKAEIKKNLTNLKSKFNSTLIK